MPEIHANQVDVFRRDRHVRRRLAVFVLEFGRLAHLGNRLLLEGFRLFFLQQLIRRMDDGHLARIALIHGNQAEIVRARTPIEDMCDWLSGFSQSISEGASATFARGRFAVFGCDFFAMNETLPTPRKQNGC